MAESRMRPIILVGGGTGGHFFPLLAVAEELAAQGEPFILVGSKSGKEKELALSRSWKFISLTAGKWRRYLTAKALLDNVIDLARLIIGVVEAIFLLVRVRPPAVFSKGGYVALPMIIACLLLGRRLIIHESDAVMGLTNRIAARFAAAVLVAFEPKIYPGADRRYRQVGVPVRFELRQAAKLSAPRKARPLILVIAGLQGSMAINRLIRENLAALIRLTDVIHITGNLDYLAHKHLAQTLPARLRSAYKPFSFIDRQLPYYYQVCDLIVSRSSATVLAEAALFARAVYLIPLPTAASNHQRRNAELLAEREAAIMRDEHALTPHQFLDDLRHLLGEKAELERIGGNLRGYFMREDAVAEIVKILLKQT